LSRSSLCLAKFLKALAHALLEQGFNSERAREVTFSRLPAEVRGVPGLARFTGEVVFAAKREGADCILGDAARLQYKVLLVLLLGPRTRDACNIYPCIPF